MSQPEYLRLQWNNFEANFKGALQELREERNYFDVTLACEDKQIEAHRLILSACSPFFRSILGKNPHKHAIFYFKGVPYKHLVSLVDFMYQGHVDVAQESLQDFLNVADDLKVQGLSDEGEEERPVSLSNTLDTGPPVDTGPPEKRKLTPPSQSVHNPHLAKRFKSFMHKCSFCQKDFGLLQHLEFHIEKHHELDEEEGVEDKPADVKEKEIIIKMEPSIAVKHRDESDDPFISNLVSEQEEDNSYQSNMDYNYQISSLDASAKELNWDEYKVMSTRQPRTTMNIEEKMKIIEQLISIPKKSQMDIARSFGISQKQVSRISQKKEKILREYEASSKNLGSGDSLGLDWP